MSLATRSEFYRSALWAGFSRIHYTKQYETVRKGVEEGVPDLEQIKALVEPSKGQSFEHSIAFAAVWFTLAEDSTMCRQAKCKVSYEQRV